MKILDYLKYILKGETMKIEFNPAQLSRPQNVSLVKVLDVLQAKNKNELVVTPVEFPIKLKVKLDDSETLLGWDAVKHSYIVLENPESTPESKQIPTPKLEPESELDLSPVFERAEALASALMNLTKPLNIEQRIEVWCKFCIVLSKEYLK
ncbi:hypothetical protein ES703_41570 [subsurface metagenome]